MKTHNEAEQLAAAMTSVGEFMGIKMSHLLSPLDEPLGCAVGTLEVAECVEVLQGKGPRDVVELVLDLAQKVTNVSRSELERWLKDGRAWKKFISIVYGQDGDATALEKILDVNRAPIVQPFLAKANGVIKKMDARTIGRASVFLGGGRHKTDDEIDYAVGFSKIKKIGEMVVHNEPLLFVHARTEHSLNSVMPLLEKAIEID